MIDDRRKIIAEINGWIEGHIPFREKNRIKAEINRRSNEEIRQLQELINNKQDLSPDDFKQRLQELKEEQKQRQNSQTSQPEENTGEEQMSDTEQLTSEEQKFFDDNKNDLDGADIKSIKKAYEFFSKDPATWKQEWASYIAAETDSQNESNNEGNTATTVDENEPGTHASNENSEWMNGLVEQYQTAYDANPQTQNQYNINGELQDDGSYLIAIDPKEEGKTGTAAQYYDRNHFAIRTSKNNVEPKDQSFEHFKNHIAVAKENGSDEIAMGNTQSAVFRTKLAAAVLATEGMSLHTPLKETDSLDFSPETLKEIPAETQGKLLEFALQNGAAIENPILDFNNEAVKNLPEELKYKYLATLLQNEETKGQIKNAPEIDLFVKDSNGNRIENKSASYYSVTVGKSSSAKFYKLEADENGELITKKNAEGKSCGVYKDENGQEQLLPVKDNHNPNLPYVHTVDLGNNNFVDYGIKKMISYQQYSPENSNFSKEDLETLRSYKREQQLKNIRENNAEKANIHDKVAALRQQLKGKTGEERKTTLTNAKVTEQEHGVNFYKYAQKHTQNTN